MILSQAREVAIETGHKLLPYAEKLNIAGSIRRKMNHVKDIELVVLPKTYEQKDMFGATADVLRSEKFMETAMSLGKVLKGKPSGRYMQIWLPAGINLDLFIPTPEDYYRIYAIRTGSANYAHLFIATAWKKLGWVGTEDGLRRKEQCDEIRHGDKSKWVCKHPSPAMPPVWENEQDFFQWLDIPYLDAALRNY